VKNVQQEDQPREKEVQNQQQGKVNYDIKAGQVKINFYTDPLCCWSWAFDQHWRRLLHEYADQIDYTYVMCGMIANWNSYNDPMNSVSRPLQMGPVWMHASEVTHVKMKYSIWHEDPPGSSYPACIAVKTAGLQSALAEHTYLYHIRKALMDEGLNIARPENLVAVAEGIGDACFDVARFKSDWQSGGGKDAFRTDIQKAKFHNIGRYPTLTLQNAEGKGILIVGYRPYEVLDQALMQVLIK
jgi:putative protein-disulfide isomerase